MKKNERLTIKDTKKYGVGVFATTHIIKGEIIHVLNGKTITLNQLVKRVLSGKEKMNDPLQVGRRTYIDLDVLSRAFNHSCAPNAGLRKRSELFALNDIKSGDQICYDYSLTISPTQWDMKCDCGSQKCRKVLHDIQSIPKKQLLIYRANGNIQKYMRKILSQIELGKYKIPKYELAALKKLGYK